MSRCIVFAPGKLMLAGEWAVLELGNPCIVMGIKKGITVTVAPSDTFSINTSIFVRCAVDVVLRYLCEQNYSLIHYKLIIRSEISGGRSYPSIHPPTLKLRVPLGTNGGKCGFGSSAAVVVATVKALLQFHGHDISSEKTKKIIFKLSCIAHYQAQDNIGSCFDVAASVYGGVLVYKKFDPIWLEKKLKNYKISNIVAQDWPFLEITPIQLPPSVKIKAVFSGESANTRELVQQMYLFKKRDKKTYDKICKNIANIVKKLILAIEQQDCEKILFFIKQNRILLQKLSEKSGLDLETQSLKKICDDAQRQGCAAKFSGAGGGDCAIVVCKTA